MPRFVFENRADKNNERALYDTRRGRNEIIGMIDDEYVPLFEKLLNTTCIILPKKKGAKSASQS